MGQAHIPQEVCPWNEKFVLPLREVAFRPRDAIAGKDAPTLAREILTMGDEDFRTAFKGSPMKRAKLRGLKRNAAIVLGNGDASASSSLTAAMPAKSLWPGVHRLGAAADLLPTSDSSRANPRRVGRAIDGRVAVASLESA